VLYNNLHPIKVNSVKKAIVLDKQGKIRAEAAAAFSKENKTTVAKITWLSRKESSQTYRLIVVYLTKNTNAQRLLDKGFFHTRGEPGITSAFKHRPRLTQCYNCQEIRHKAF
jgi:preprotein translocase subunit SecE